MNPRTPVVLLTGFEPFDGDPENPSWEAARCLHGRRVAGHRIVARRLPVAFDASLRALRRALRETRPAAVLCTGLAATRARISLERVAVNLDDAPIPDNAGSRPADRPVVAGAPAAYFSTLPVKRCLHALREAGIPAEVSQSAGTYVCNHVFYGLMHALRRRPRVAAGFVHVPYSPALAAHRPGAPSLAVETVAAGLRIVLRCALEPGSGRGSQAGPGR